MKNKECIAMILAGGQGSRLGVLTRNVAKPAVQFGGKYRIIDFPLTNCALSGIDTVGVLTQYKPLELNTYIGSGQPWDLDRNNGGVFLLPPYMKEKQGEWYKGTANAIYQNIEFIDKFAPRIRFDTVRRSYLQNELQQDDRTAQGDVRRLYNRYDPRSYRRSAAFRNTANGRN